MKTKYRIVVNFNDKFQCQHKKWYWMDWRNIEICSLSNHRSDAIDRIETYKRKLVYDKNKTVVWQSDETEVKESVFKTEDFVFERIVWPLLKFVDSAVFVAIGILIYKFLMHAIGH